MKTILIIEDQDACRLATAALLRASDWTVIEASDGERGIELALKHRPDVILCDLFMPRCNGFNVCRSVRAHIELRHTKLLVMSGGDYAADREAAAEAGASEYLLKPFGIEHLEEALARQLFVERDGFPPPIVNPQRNGSEAQAVVRFWGVRGSIPTPGPGTIAFGGNTSCVEVRADGEIIICDAGTGIRPLGLALAKEMSGAPMQITLLVTHTHWDHIQGFPFFLPAYGPKNHLHILGYEGASAGLAATLAGQMESPYFPIALKEMPGNIRIEELKEMKFNIGRVRVTACFMKHPGVCVGYRLFTSGGSIVFIPDNEWSMEDVAAVRNGTASDHARALLEFIRGADVLMLDAQYNREEYKSHVGWGHGCVDDVVALAAMADVKRLYLFHHDPGHDDVFMSGVVERARSIASSLGSPLEVDAAREGTELVLSPQPAVGGGVPA